MRWVSLIETESNYKSDCRIHFLCIPFLKGLITWKTKIDFEQNFFILSLISWFYSILHPIGHALVILLAAQMNVMLKQEDVFAKTMSKASIVRGIGFFLQLYPVFSVFIFQIQKIADCILISFRCKPGFFNLESSNPRGCTPCFCFGHSSVCTNALGYSVYSITSTFQIGKVDLFLWPLEL